MTIRLQGDFNGLFGDVLCLSHVDACRDEAGNDVTLTSGMIVTAFEPDEEADGTPSELFACGVVEPSPEWLQCKGSRWCLKIDSNGVRHRSDLK